MLQLARPTVVNHRKSEGIMSDHNPTMPVARRSFLARLAAGVSMAGVSLVARAPEAAAQSARAGGGRFQPAQHTQDDWMDTLPGKHRFVFDATTAPTFGAALAYANNFFMASDTGYGLKDPDAAVIIVARHFATPFAYKDAVWAKYGTPLTGVTSLSDPKTKQPPTVNLYNTAGYDNLANMGTTVDTLLKRGVHFAVCQLATKFFAGMLAGPSGNADAVYNEVVANLIPNSHLVAAGIVAVNRAQERGYTLATPV
jgi:intracellular sulfur oxidation DsrE/DsrF family protein